MNLPKICPRTSFSGQGQQAHPLDPGNFKNVLGQEETVPGQAKNVLGQEKNVLGQEKNVLGHFFPRADFRKVSLSCPRTGKKCPRTFFPAGRFEKNVLVLS